MHFTHFIDENKNNDFISNTSTIRTRMQINDTGMHTLKKRVMNKLRLIFLRQVSEFIDKWGIDMVPIAMHSS